MIIAFSILFILFGIAVLFITAPIRISGLVSGDLYNGGAGLDVQVSPLWGALGAGVLRPEGGAFSVWVYIGGRRLIKIPLPKEKDEKVRESNEISADFEVGETIESIDLKDIGQNGRYSAEDDSGGKTDFTKSIKYEKSFERKTSDFSVSDKSKKETDTASGDKKPRKSLRERIGNILANAKKYMKWIKTGLRDLWYIIRIELLAGHVTVGLVNHPATIGSIMGGFTALNGILPKPFRITVRSEFTRTALEGRIEAELSIYLHRLWITIIRRRKLILDIWREYKQSEVKEAEVLSVESDEKENVRDDEPAHAL